MILKFKLVVLLCRARRYAFRLRFFYGKHRTARILAGRCGFFGNMFLTLHGIRLCEAAGVLPLPCWDKESLFFEAAHGGNVWDYYFEQINSPGINYPAKDPSRIAFKPDASRISPLYNGLGVRETYHQCIERYVKLREPIKKEITLVKAELFGDHHVIGVHARFTDTHAGFENRNSQPLLNYFKKIDDYSALNPVDLIFIATDYLPALQQFKRRYGSRVVALDCIRSVNNTSIHGHYDSGLQGSPYLKGLEVLMDAYLLSSVSHLFGTRSRVAAYSLCLNPNLNSTDVGEDSSAGHKSLFRY